MATVLGFLLLCAMGFGFGASVACGVYFTMKGLRNSEVLRGRPSKQDIRKWGAEIERKINCGLPNRRS